MMFAFSILVFEIARGESCFSNHNFRSIFVFFIQLTGGVKNGKHLNKEETIISLFMSFLILS